MDIISDQVTLFIGDRIERDTWKCLDAVSNGRPRKRRGRVSLQVRQITHTHARSKVHLVTDIHDNQRRPCIAILYRIICKK